jgi:hypothetical protein
MYLPNSILLLFYSMGAQPSVPERDIILSYPILCYSILFYLSNSSMINFKIPFSSQLLDGLDLFMILRVGYRLTM